ncbi:MAG: Gfo/Idh/MocA family protein [Pirellulaceae bacterium]
MPQPAPSIESASCQPSSRCSSRRRFLSSTASAAALVGASTFHSSLRAQPKLGNVNEQLGIGCIGLRYQGSVIAHKAAMYGRIVAVCDVDKNVRDPVKAAFGSTPRDYEDYQQLLNDKNVDVVTIGTPDHWHTKMVIDAVRSQKDIYCEKPLTLTIDEGKKLVKIVNESDQVVQVGSWQRSDRRFRQAVEMVRAGRVGTLREVQVVLGKNKTGGPFKARPVPLGFNWDLWQGQTPNAPYLAERSHYTFRWWYEYSGGQMTDWGAHHLDIAQWAIASQPTEISGRATYPDGTKTRKPSDSFNVALDFSAEYQFANGVRLTVSDSGRNGIMFIGDEGRIFVNRGTLSGKPVEDLASTPLPSTAWNCYDYDNFDRPLRAGKLDAIINHMGNFFDCIRDRSVPISDIESQHRSVSTCHLGNIAMRLGRKLSWDPEKEEFLQDAEANSYLSREQRTGYEVG